MQKKFQHTFTKSKMNKDLDARLLGSDEYRDGKNIAVSRSESDDVGALENILGNEVLSSLGINIIPVENNQPLVPPLNRSNITSYDNYTSRCIGWHINEKTNKVYLFITNWQDSSDDQISNFQPITADNPPNRYDQSRIIMVDTVTKNTIIIVRGRFLNFSINSPILDTVMIEDLLFWTDDRNQPRVINVVTAENNNTYYSHEDHVSVVKYYPYKPIELSETFSLKTTIISATQAKTLGDTQFDALYPPILIQASSNFTGTNDYLTESQKDILRNNIGLDGWMIATSGSYPGDVISFKVAYVYETPTTGSYTFPQDFLGCFMVFPDRDLSAFTTITTGSYIAPSVVVGFNCPTSKNVSSPWLKEGQTKLTVHAAATTSGNVYYTDTTANNYGYSRSIFEYGSRSPYNELLYPTTTNTGSNYPARMIPGKFTKNTGDAANLYCRVTHPRLDPNKYYIVHMAGNPQPNATGRYFLIAELTSFENGTISPITNASDVVQPDDVLTIHWPNKYYNSEFIGDSAFLEDKFVRFAYRFKYDDGQHSLISPFTQEVFIPKQGGYFTKEIGSEKSKSGSNNYVDQLAKAGQTTINNEIMENDITQVALRIPCEYPVNTLVDNLKVSEVEILYKESMSSNINIVEKIKVNEAAIADNSTNFLTYTYESKEPIKTLRSQETTRVYDNAPVRAKTLSSSGNRLILGNFYDRHSSPGNLNYYVGASPKLKPSEAPVTLFNSKDESSLKPKAFNKNSYVAYPNHSLKQNRTYQVGLILQDRYGRSSDVIISNVEEDSFQVDGASVSSGAGAPYRTQPATYGGSTVFHPYKDSVLSPVQAASVPETRAGIIDWPGDSLKLLFTQTIPGSLPLVQGYPGLYDDPIITTVSANIYSQYYAIVPVGGLNDNIQPGMKVEYTFADDSPEFPGKSFTWYVYRVLNGASGQGNLISLINLQGKGALSTEMPNYRSQNRGIKMTFSFFSNPLGWNSYKVVVKQLQQDYYNVYMPSLLDGTPVIKPFNLNCTFEKSSNKVTVDPIGDIEYLTFPLLEGMKVVAGTNTYYINNILNYKEFEITAPAVEDYTAQPAPLKTLSFGYFQPVQADMTAGTSITGVAVQNNATDGGNGSGAIVTAQVTTVSGTKELKITLTSNGVNYKNGDKLFIPANVASAGSSGYPQIDFILTSGNIENRQTNFSTQSSDGVLNTSTWLTDNANKVPPALNEASPVQVNYSTSDSMLIPRTARQTDWILTANSPFYTTNDHTMPIFPGKKFSKVQTIGNFENLFKRGSYNGLYAADTDPPTAIIENNFKLGEDSETSKPTSEKTAVPAIYETSPNVSNLEIYYETSTAGSIRELNQFVREVINIPTYANIYNNTTAIRRVIIAESIDYTSSPTVATVQLRDQNGTLLKYYDSNSALINIRNISISEPVYSDGTTVAGGGISFEKFSNTDADNRFLIKLSETFPGYNSQYDDVNNILFNVNLEYKVLNYTKGVNKDVYNTYSIPFKLFIDNVAPQINGASVSGGVYYLKNNTNEVDPTAYESNGTVIKTWTNTNGDSTTLSAATNGGNVNNTFQDANTSELKYRLLIRFDGATEYVEANTVNQSGLYLDNQGLLPGEVLLGVTGRSIIVDSNIDIRIDATDNNGFGITKVISEFTVRFLPT